jgi:O-acetyl-ADP-ribose deacetylase (regulator of RNase III)
MAGISEPGGMDMIELVKGNIVQDDAEALVNTVNCVGIMGRGIALQFRKAFPENYSQYKAFCDAGNMRPGVMFVQDLHRLHNPRYIINFPTKRHWKGKSRIEDITLGLKALVAEVHRLRIRSIAVPPLGCGLGGLDWAVVRPMIIDAFQSLPDIRVRLHEPGDAPASERMALTSVVPIMTEGRAALLQLMRRYLAAVMEPAITLLEVHKLMYFMQEAGEPLRLRYRKAPYGPYAENLRHVLIPIEGHWVVGYGDGEDRPDKVLELLPHAAREAEEYLTEHESTRRRFDRVAELTRGFESTFGMELLSTVHWVATREHAASADDAMVKARAWNERKWMFEPRHVCLAWERLEQQGWFQ